jgi:hypothetical protein
MGGLGVRAEELAGHAQRSPHHRVRVAACARESHPVSFLVNEVPLYSTKYQYLGVPRMYPIYYASFFGGDSFGMVCSNFYCMRRTHKYAASDRCVWGLRYRRNDLGVMFAVWMWCSGYVSWG